MSVTVPLTFCPKKEAMNVEVAGSYNDWTKVPMTIGQKSQNSDESENSSWSISLELEPGLHQYKYIVDGDWVIDSELPTVDNNMGGLNNLIKVEGDLSDEDLHFLMMKTEKSEREMKDYYRLFKRKHPTGYINYKDFKKMTNAFYTMMIRTDKDPLAQYAVSESDEVAKYAFSKYDTDGTGFLTFKEVIYALFLTREGGGCKYEKMKFAFRLYDLNKNGVIEKKEFVEFLAAQMPAMCQAVYVENLEFIEKNVTATINYFDTNFDDVISEKEFIEGCIKNEDVFDGMNLWSVMMNGIFTVDGFMSDFNKDKCYEKLWWKNYFGW